MTVTSSTKSTNLIIEHHCTVTTTSHGSLGGQQTSTPTVGFQSASSLLKTSNFLDTDITSSITLAIPSTSMKSSTTVEHTPMTYQRDKIFNDNTKSTLANRVLSFGPDSSYKVTPTITSVELTHPSLLSHQETSHETMGCNSRYTDVGDTREHPLVIDDNSETSHDYSEASHDHSMTSHDIHMSNDNEHCTEASHDYSVASHDTHMSHNSKHDKQKVANLVVCVLNPYLKKGRIANKVMECIGFFSCEFVSYTLKIVTSQIM